MPENSNAFPSVCQDDPGHPVSAPGMSLRDWFAGQALSSVMADIDVVMMSRENGRTWTETVARTSYDIADAMIIERERQP